MKTYSEWNALGYRIHKGSKAKGFKNGEALFTIDQCYNPLEYNISPKHEEYLIHAQEWEEMPH